MKPRNPNSRGQVAGQSRRLRTVSNKGAAYWAKKSGERRPVVGGSLVELEARLAKL